MSENIIIKDYKLFKSIGKGAFGKVYLTIKEGSPELFATKMIEYSKIKDPKILNYLKNEIQIMKELNHPNIIKLHEVLYTKRNIYLIMEYCNGGSLLDLLNQHTKQYRKPFSIKIIQYFMRQIIEGLAYIHSNKIIHRDIKLANILLKFRNNRNKNKIEYIDIADLDESDFLSSEIKIIDFGLSKKLDLDELAKTIAGTPFNMPPTILDIYNKGQQSKGYNEKADIWSLGTICYQMLTGEQLFKVKNLIELIKKVHEKNYSIRTDIELSNEVISFLNSMLQYNGELRLSAEELLKHEFLTKDPKDFIKVNVKDSFNQNKVIMEKYIECLYKDYKEAKEYFGQNNLPEQEKDAYNKCQQIENIKKQLIIGNKINLSDLPKQIEPEYIYNCSSIERNKKFNEILSKYIADKNILEVKIKSFQDKNSLEQSIKEKYENYKIKYNKLKKIIHEFENLLKNIWVPPPKYIKEMKQIVNEKICYDNCEYKIKIQIKEKENLKENLNFIFTFLVNEDKTLKKKVELRDDNNFDEEWIWALTAYEWRNVDNNNDNFILGIENNENQTIYIDISKIKKGKGITVNQHLPNIMEKINIGIEPLIPKGETIQSVEFKEILKIEKVYPPFEWKSSDIYEFPILIGINNNIFGNS